MDPLTLRDIEQARKRLEGRIVRTPILTSSLLNHWLGHEILFKAECFQRIGAFKARGGLNMVSWLMETGKKPERLIASSSGNHAQAVAWAGGQFGIPSTIFMPDNASSVKVQATRSYGAEVVLCETRQIADARVQTATAQEGAQWIPPYNHAQIVCGQGTAAYEALKEVEDVDAVFAPCGGGGLLSGTFIATRGLSPGTRVIGAEPAMANDAATSRRIGSIQSLKQTPETMADGARTLSIGEVTFDYIRQLDEFYEVKEQEIAYWAQWLPHVLKVRVEPTSAMTMDAVLQWLRARKKRQRVLVILSGGNVDQKMMQRIWAKNSLDSVPSL